MQFLQHKISIIFQSDIAFQMQLNLKRCFTCYILVRILSVQTVRLWKSQHLFLWILLQPKCSYSVFWSGCLLVHNWHSQILKPTPQTLLPPFWPAFPCHALYIDLRIHQERLCKDPERDNPRERSTLVHSSTSRSWPLHAGLSFSRPAVTVLNAIDMTVVFHNNHHSFTARCLWEVPQGKKTKDVLDTFVVDRFQNCCML